MFRNNLPDYCRLESSQILFVGILICICEGRINLFELIIAASIFLLIKPRHSPNLIETNKTSTGP